MSDYLPYARVKWLKNVDHFAVNSVGGNSPTGYILEVHLKYSGELLALHNDYPLAPQKLAIPYGMLSEYFKNIAHKYGIW